MIDHRKDCQLLTVETYGLCTCDFDDRKRAEEMSAFGASDAACYHYPGADQQKERAAYIAGASSVVVDPKRLKYLEDICHEANSYIGLAKMALQQGDIPLARKRLDQYSEAVDRLEVRYLGFDTASKLLASGIIHPTPAFAHEISKLELEAEIKRLQGVIERDRSRCADIYTNTRKVMTQHEWLRLGRGSYEHNDDRWKDEFGECMDRVGDALVPLVKLAGDLTDSPKDREDVKKARAFDTLTKAAQSFLDWISKTQTILDPKDEYEKLQHNLTVAIGEAENA